MSLSDLRLLRSFVTVAEELHVGRAARRLNIAQPPLSRRLQQLERELGVALFDRRRRRLQLTPAGREFRVEARSVLDLADRAVAALRRAAGVEAGRLRIGFVEAATASGLLPGAMARLRRSRPRVRYELRELPSREQVEALRREDLDVAIVYNRPADMDGLELRTILPGRSIAVIGRTHPLARRRRLSLGDIARGPIILWTRDINAGRYEATLAAFRAAGVRPRAWHHAEQLQTIVDLAAAGAGVGLVPDSQAKVSLGIVVYRPVRGLDVPMDLELVWRANETSPVVAAFVAAMQAEAKRRSRRR
jgi:DNA-binding transcriptional LysR family regulator